MDEVVPEGVYLEAMRQVDVLRVAVERVVRWLDAGGDPQYVSGARAVLLRALEEAEL